MSQYDTFTEQEKKTYQEVHDLEHAIAAAIDPSTFVLNKDVIGLQQKLFNLRQGCQHRYENGFCIICGSEESHA